jgi:hypothetical protein
MASMRVTIPQRVLISAGVRGASEASGGGGYHWVASARAAIPLRASTSAKVREAAGASWGGGMGKLSSGGGGGACPTIADWKDEGAPAGGPGAGPP